ncbi:coordinator of PRMT5 and differentiation stimulator isoform X1 [Oryx dammah]|uniref:coordinator of PRMT5 and differentiation stimulator isoform X1 n=1 Tax=Oryx dammah TaxID=59534 RepID=UPI001A9AF4A4|nr:coordinator of PRMT5 and differentiation stimulator isoform X1 [Oryx dammah]
MDPPTARAQALGAAEQPRGLQLPSGREAPLSPGAAFAPADHSSQERAPENATDRLANGAQSIPHDSAAHGEGTHCEEEGFAEDDEDSDGDPSPWELSEGMSGCLPKEQAGDLFHEDWDLELKADQGNPYDADDIQGCLSQEVRPWVCCAPQGDMIYDPSWHHPPPLIPHYSKMVFETGQFDDAED